MPHSNSARLIEHIQGQEVYRIP